MDAEAARPHARRDPLLDPLAVTEHCVIGDQIRLPAACCDVLGCGAEFADLAALGEADNRARALVAGWRADAFGRLVCPACQLNDGVTGPRMPGPGPGTSGSPAPVGGPPGPDDAGGPPVSPGRGGGRGLSVRARIAGSRGAVAPGRHRMAQWLHVLSGLVSGLDTLVALASGNNGWGAPQPVTGPRREGTSRPVAARAGAAGARARLRRPGPGR